MNMIRLTRQSSSSLGILLFAFLVLSISLVASSIEYEDDYNFLQCLSRHSDPSILTYTSKDSNFSSVLFSTIQSLRFYSPAIRKPRVIVTPLKESHVQASVICSKRHGFQIRVRSGGHDYEGLSYVSDVPFVVVDLSNLRSINMDVENRTAWVQSGAITGELYYRIAEKSRNLGFPSVFCPTVGVGGSFQGGGYGNMLRKYGLAADNVIDARIVDAQGRVLDKESMGEDLFWAIRGGGMSFGIVVSWKIRLVYVPTNVTVFTINKNLDQGATKLVHRWQEVASELPHELFVRASISVVNSTSKEGEKTILASFPSLYLGNTENLLAVMKEKFPELGLERKDCADMSWIQSQLYINGFPLNGSLDILLSRNQVKRYAKIKSDYVKKPIPETGLEGLWKKILEEKSVARMNFSPNGGRMAEISECEIPFPHRQGNLYSIQYVVGWEGAGSEAAEPHIRWMRELHEYMTPYVSNSPREAYLNYRDIDVGQSINGTATYLEGMVWGSKYFKSNYERLVQVKSKVDPENFFRNEQSIPAVA
ncbi:hypothetical protein C5167_022274 [Papaver somniferum]|uniref:FAD-binding PCMH-type domain-containing protein n=2 Tax=Papaver somniferum TaxID=3469 RepID=A0A4Y7JIZ1_PAPSO|nr:hypothetical protein C5167_022274 [Papaver somniferum]